MIAEVETFLKDPDSKLERLTAWCGLEPTNPDKTLFCDVLFDQSKGTPLYRNPMSRNSPRNKQTFLESFEKCDKSPTLEDRLYCAEHSRYKETTKSYVNRNSFEEVVDILPVANTFTPREKNFFFHTRLLKGLTPYPITYPTTMHDFISSSLSQVQDIYSKPIDTIDRIKSALLAYCTLILAIHGYPNKHSQSWLTPEQLLKSGLTPSGPKPELGNKTRCIFLKENHLLNGCKSDEFPMEKTNLMNWLSSLLVLPFRIASLYAPALLENTDPYISELQKAVELYCQTIGLEQLGPIYRFVRPLELEINKCFREPVLLQRCSPTERGFGCARLSTVLKKESDSLTNKFKIVLISMDNDTGTMNLNMSVNLEKIRKSIGGKHRTGRSLRSTGGRSTRRHNTGRR